MTTRNHSILLLIFFCTLLLITGCARIVSPSGGPRDTTPPVILKEQPENQSVNFTEKNIRITFDEFIVLNSPSENILISPPLKNTPDYTIKGKSLNIYISDTLRENTTYNILFSNAIKDFTEGNLIPLSQYTFSTGDYVDSFMIKGFVQQANSKDPVSNVFVFLYHDDVDSLPLTTLPDYVTRTQKDGHFYFYNIAEGNYKLFALKDINSNYIFDLPNEHIAFSDVTFPASPIESHTDTLPTTDSVDHVILVDEHHHDEPILRFFEQEDTVQRLLKPINNQPAIYKIVYKQPFDKFEVLQLKPDSVIPYMEAINSTRDTITWYFRQPITDSLVYQLTVDQLAPDTLVLLPYKQPVQKDRRGGGAKTATPNNLAVQIANGEDLYKPLTLNFDFPILPIDSFPVTIIQKGRRDSDTIIRYYSAPDTFLLSLPIPFPIEENLSYSIIIRDSIFTGYNGRTNDSILSSFTIKSEKDYGHLQMEYVVKDHNSNYIITLLSSENKIMQSDIISKSRRIEYKNIAPGSYKIKVIIDANRNGRWDTGNYHKKRQPEEIIFYNKPLQVRGLWELEETFDIEEVRIDSKH